MNERKNGTDRRWVLGCVGLGLVLRLFRIGHQNIWIAERTGGEWSEARLLGPPISTEANEFFPSLTHDDTLYFTRGEDAENAAIYRSRFVDGRYGPVERLPAEGRKSFLA